MYLIKVEMDRNLPEVRRALGDCQKMHQLVTALFASDRQSAQILYRTKLVHNRLQIYIYAQCPLQVVPDRYDVLQKYITPWLDTMADGQVWRFDLVAVPSKKVKTEGKRNSQRRILREPAQRQAWLERKAAQSGFSLLHAAELEKLHISGKHAPDHGGIMYHDAYHYQGVLQITDAEAFRSALRRGIGSGKAYGFGMMLVKAL